MHRRFPVLWGSGAHEFQSLVKRDHYVSQTALGCAPHLVQELLLRSPLLQRSFLQVKRIIIIMDNE